MTLRDHTLFDGTIDKVQVAIDRLKAFEPPEGYYLAFSGGKDSITIKRLADLAGVQYDAHYNVTTVDPPELVQFIREVHPDVTWDKPSHSMWQAIVNHGCPPTRLMRYCCEELKERGGDGRLVVTGVRWAESPRRRTRQMVEPCYTGRKHYLHPIIDWTDADVWAFIRQENLPYCQLYDEGFARLGCVMCPMGDTRQMARDALRWPKYHAAYLRAFGRMLHARDAAGKETAWQTAEDVMHWWVYNPPKEDDRQMAMFS